MSTKIPSKVSKDWKSWKDFLGTEQRKYIPFEEAKRIVRSIQDKKGDQDNGGKTS